MDTVIVLLVIILLVVLLELYFMYKVSSGINGIFSSNYTDMSSVIDKDMSIGMPPPGSPKNAALMAAIRKQLEEQDQLRIEKYNKMYGDRKFIHRHIPLGL